MALPSPLKITTHPSPIPKRTHLPPLITKKQRSQTLASLSGSVPVQTLTRVAYQGVPGAYSEFAAKTASPNCTPLPCRSLPDTITAVETGRADRAVLPVESTMEGTTLRNYDLLLQHNLHIVQEINLYVHYCLLAMPGVRKAELKRVISHPMALAHCDRSLTMLGLHSEPVDDTAGAVELLLSRRMLDTAAIASSRAALLYGLDVLAHGFQDESWNVTRFLILSKDRPSQRRNSGGLKTSMVVAHHGGDTLSVLMRVLSAFSSRDISLTKLEFYPSDHSHGPIAILDVNGGGCVKEFLRVLYVDFDGSIDDPTVQSAVAELMGFSLFVRVLGCYAADTNIYGLQ
eukprot:TRINITY_DN498_c0_g1_i2.p1 TRINITY_DN498_c0_g1~~TRINITY_DN498_c0_g1_i2.p1  ORF type:complete len:381 (-),score=-3.40 TRINITY_DN498_c0_g1_i2:273-1304(-)